MGRAMGINLIGDVHSESPQGQLARQFLMALDEARIPVHISAGQEVPLYDVNLVCAPADAEPPAAERWTADEFPLPVSLPSTGVWPDRAQLDLPDGFLFLVVSEGAAPHVVCAADDEPLLLTVEPNGEWEQAQVLASVDALVVAGAPAGAALLVGTAMLLERPVIGPPDLVAAERGWPVHSEAEITDAMQEVAAGGSEVERRVAAAKEHVASAHSPEVVGQAVRARLEQMSGDDPAVARMAVEARAEVEAAERRFERRLAQVARRVEDIAQARDHLAERLGHVLEDPSRPPTHVVAVARPFEVLAKREDDAGAPWTHRYNASHRALVAEALAAPDLERVFAAGGNLPPGYGRGYDERVVEYPWLFAQGLYGRMLDAGSVFNHPHILDVAQREITTLDVVTLAPEEWSYPERGISYVYADLRELPYCDGHFDTIACISTLDHVGMDNASYGADAPRAADPAAEVDRAVAELVRVLAPDGQLLITVPYGAAEDHGWLRQFDRAGVERIVAAAAPLTSAVEVFGYDERGWRRSAFDELADARYRDYRADPAPVPDGAVAARGVACIRLSRP